MNNQAIYELIERIQARAKALESERPNTVITPQFRGAMVSHCNKYLGGDGLRRAVFGLMFAVDKKPLSSKMLTPYEVCALVEWIGATKVEADWIVSDQFVSDCAMIRGFYRMDEREALIPGVSIFDSHCGICGHTTEHLYLGYRISCLVCYPELDYRKKAEQ